MDFEKRPQRIHKKAENWWYTIAPNAPDYLLVTLGGAFTGEAKELYRRDLADTYARLEIQKDHCPIIWDWREADVRAWNIPDYMRAHRGIFRPTHRMIGIPSASEEGRWTIEAMTKLAEVAYPNFHKVNSMQEALALARKMMRDSQ